MDKKQASPELSQAELPPAQEEQVLANPPLRKRQLDRDDAAELGAKRAAKRLTSEPAPLTRKNLALFNKMSGSKKSASSRRDSTGDLPTTKTPSTTASGFAIQAEKNGILDPLESKPPRNLDDICKRLAGRRATASPPKSEYENYVHAVGAAPNEATIVHAMSPLLKRYPKGYRSVLNQGFTAFPGGVGFNNGLSAPQPDYVEGLERKVYLPLQIDEYVNGAVLYRDDPRSITLPHLAGEWKGPGGYMREAVLQSGYDGAALVYARNQAFAYQGKSDPPGHASVTTFATNGRELEFYAHYAAPGRNGKLEYHQYPVASASLARSHQEHKKGRRHLRNAQDHARQQSYELRDELEEYYEKQRGGGLHPVATRVPSLPIPTLILSPATDNNERPHPRRNRRAALPATGTKAAGRRAS